MAGFKDAMKAIFIPNTEGWEEEITLARDPALAAPSNKTMGDRVKNKVDAKVASFSEKVKNAVFNVIDSRFGKGMVLTGVVLVAAAALILGWKGAHDGLMVGGRMIGSEEGIFTGINMGLSFLASKAGLATLAAGGFIGKAVGKWMEEPKTLSLAEAQDMAQKLKASREAGTQQTQEKASGKEQPAPAADAVAPAGAAQTIVMPEPAEGRWAAAETIRDAGRNAGSFSMGRA